MSFCRFGKNSDVYVYKHEHGGFKLSWRQTYTIGGGKYMDRYKKHTVHEHFYNLYALLNRLRRLSCEGVKVPQSLFDRIKQEIVK